MKKISLSIVPVFFCVLLSAQSFKRGSLVLDVSTGLEIYNTRLDVTVKDPFSKRDTSYNDKAASTNYAVSAECGLSKRIGIGVRFKANKYFTDPDSVSKKKPDVRSNDLLILLNFHPVVRKHLDLVLGADFGGSVFNYKANDSLGLVLKGNGSFVSFYINPRIYFGRFGINFKVYAPFNNYSKLTTNNDQFNDYVAISKWKGNGFGLSFGIQYRFFR